METQLRVFVKPRYETEISGKFHAMFVLYSDAHPPVFIDEIPGVTQSRAKPCAELKNLSESGIRHRFLDSPAEILWCVNGPITFNVFLTHT